MQLLIDAIGSAVIRRINYPRALTCATTRRESINAKLRPLLSPHDEQDAKQTCALVLCQLGLPAPTDRALRVTDAIAARCPLFSRSACERASYVTAARTLGLDRWKACFRATRSTLRIDRRVRETVTDFSTAPEVPIAIGHPEISHSRRAPLAQQVRYAHSLLHAARQADPSRKRRSTFHLHLSTLRIFTAIWAARLVDRPLCAGNSPDALNVILHRFRAYLDKGDLALTAQSLADTAPGPQPRTLQSFASLPENYAIAD